MNKFETLKLNKRSKVLPNSSDEHNHHNSNGTVQCKGGRVRSGTKSLSPCVSATGKNKINNQLTSTTSSSSVVSQSGGASITKLVTNKSENSLPVSTPIEMGEFPIFETRSSSSSPEKEEKTTNECREKVINCVKDNNDLIVISKCVNNINKSVNLLAPSVLQLNISSSTSNNENKVKHHSNSLESNKSSPVSNCSSTFLHDQTSADFDQPSNRTIQEDTAIEIMTSSSSKQPQAISHLPNGSNPAKNREIISELRKILLDCKKTADKRPSAAEIYDELCKELP